MEAGHGQKSRVAKSWSGWAREQSHQLGLAPLPSPNISIGNCAATKYSQSTHCTGPESAGQSGIRSLPKCSLDARDGAGTAPGCLESSLS